MKFFVYVPMITSSDSHTTCCGTEFTGPVSGPESHIKRRGVSNDATMMRVLYEPMWILLAFHNRFLEREPQADFLSTNGCLRGKGFDWITGYVYMVFSGGYLLACEGRHSREFACATILTGQGDLRGIALNPTQGYWTTVQYDSLQIIALQL